MTLTQGGESRVRGYLYVLERSLRTFLPAEVALDAVREVESHIRERVDQTEPVPDERTALERVLFELGPPLRVAQAYSAEMTLDEAVATGRAVPIARAVWHMATTSVTGFGWALVVFVGWAFGLSFLLIAALKPVFPENVGFHYVNGRLTSFGIHTLGALPPGVEVHGGYWLVPGCIIVGVAILVGTQRASRRILAWMRSRRPPARVRLRVEVKDEMVNGKWQT